MGHPQILSFSAFFIVLIHFFLIRSGMLRITYVDQNDPKDPGAQSDQLTQEIAAGNYNIDLELDAAQLGLGPSGKKVKAPFRILTNLKYSC